MNDLSTSIIRNVHDWLHANHVLTEWVGRRRGTVAVSFSPGDATCYGLLFTWVEHAVASPGEYNRINEGQPAVGIIAGTAGADHGRLIPASSQPNPHPEYVAEKFGTENAHTVTAVGVIWSLMAGTEPEEVAARYSDWRPQDGAPTCADVITQSWTEFAAAAEARP